MLLNISSISIQSNDVSLKWRLCSDELAIFPHFLDVLRSSMQLDLVTNVCGAILNCSSTYELRCYLLTKKQISGFSLIDTLIGVLRRKFSDNRVPLFVTYIMIKYSNIDENHGCSLLTFGDVVAMVPILADMLIDRSDDQLKCAVCR